MKLSQIKRLGLPKKKENELLRLRARESRLHKLLGNYDPYWVDKELQEIDDALATLIKKRKDIVEKRQKPSEGKQVEFGAQLKLNRQKQNDIIMQHGLLGKLSKAINTVKGIEKSGLAPKT